MDNPSVQHHQQQAAGFDQRVAKMAPLRDALHFLMARVMSDLPRGARVLCVGVGTGAELLELAQVFPQWRFTAVEPAAAMLTICRQKVDAAGFSERVDFHDGYLDSLPPCEPFDAATSLLVSHFITDDSARQAYFSTIAERLAVGGLLINADLAADTDTMAFGSLLAVWLRMLAYAGMSDDEVERMRAAFGQSVALRPPSVFAAMVASAGFTAPVLFFQGLLMHAWFTQRV